MLSTRITKLAITEGQINEWKTQPVDKKSSFILLVAFPDGILVTITGPTIIRLTHTNQHPFKVYTRKNDIAIKFWSIIEMCWRKTQVTLTERSDLLTWVQKFCELGITVVNKDQVYPNDQNEQEAQIMETQITETQITESQVFNSQVQKPSYMPAPAPVQPIPHQPHASKLLLHKLSEAELKAEVMDCLKDPDFVKLVSTIFYKHKQTTNANTNNYF